MKLPWMKLFFDDLDDDCGSLSLAARGGWMWIIGNLHHHGGERSLPIDGWARVIRASTAQTVAVLQEIISTGTCHSNVTRDGVYQNSDALIMIRCRRIYREYKSRESHALRQQRYRNKQSSNPACDASVTDKDVEVEAKKHKKITSGAAAPSARPDLAYEIFAKQYAETLGCPYVSTKGDFVLLAKLRRSFGVGPRETPTEWDKSCANYCSTPMGKYTIADLCSRYAVFRNGALDRFNKPTEAKNGHKPTPAPMRVEKVRDAAGNILFMREVT